MHYIITGGCGYIGGHMAILLNEQGHRVTILDNFSNSSHQALHRLQNLCNNKLNFMELDVCDTGQLDTAFTVAELKEPIAGVLHFAGLKAVGESSSLPLKYYQNNLISTLSLIEIMQKRRVFKLVFSSSATVYGDPENLPVNENAPTSTTNPYGATKLICENILQDVAMSHPEWRIVLLRYFNPVGAHASGKFGEEPNGTPNNLMPYVFDVASGQREQVNVFGDDYDTSDGTGVRDYIHVTDLVEGHAAALRYLDNEKGVHTFNLGTGNGFSVMEMIRKTEEITGQPVPYKIQARRQGDLGAVYGDVRKAKALLKWRASHTIEDMISDQWRWQKNREFIDIK
jgi:UDP-glucose 4-epimerase